MNQDAEARSAELAEHLAAVRARIDAAAQLAGRDPRDVALLVVTKTFPAQDAVALAALGCTDFGESRDQEAKAKVAEVSAAGIAARWHMIGQVQRKKAKSVAQWADVVESVDRVELASALAVAAQAMGRTLDVLLQVDLDPEPLPGRGGCRPVDVPGLAESVLSMPGLVLGGIMAVAPHPGDPGEAFARLAAVHRELLALAPGARTVSAGMSGDLEQAVAHGATQVRIGGAILGNRPPLG